MKFTKSTKHLRSSSGISLYLVCQNISNCTCASKEELMRRISSRIIEVGKVWSTWTFDDLVTCQFCQFCSKSICGCCRAMVRTCAVWTALRKGNLSWHLLFRVKMKRMDQIWPDTLEVHLWSTQIVHLSFLDQHKSCRHNPSQQELRNLVWKAVGDAGMELEPEMGLSFGEGRGRCYWGILYYAKFWVLWVYRIAAALSMHLLLLDTYGHLMLFSTVFDSQEFHVLGYLGLLDKCGTCWYQHCPKKSLKLRPGFSARARAPSWLTPSGGCALRLWLHVNGATTVPNYVCRPHIRF